MLHLVGNQNSMRIRNRVQWTLAVLIFSGACIDSDAVDGSTNSGTSPADSLFAASQAAVEIVFDHVDVDESAGFYCDRPALQGLRLLADKSSGLTNVRGYATCDGISQLSVSPTTTMKIDAQSATVAGLDIGSCGSLLSAHFDHLSIATTGNENGSVQGEGTLQVIDADAVSICPFSARGKARLDTNAPTYARIGDFLTPFDAIEFVFSEVGRSSGLSFEGKFGINSLDLNVETKLNDLGEIRGAVVNLKSNVPTGADFSIGPSNFADLAGNPLAAPPQVIHVPALVASNSELGFESDGAHWLLNSGCAVSRDAQWFEDASYPPPEGAAMLLFSGDGRAVGHFRFDGEVSMLRFDAASSLPIAQSLANALTLIDELGSRYPLEIRVEGEPLAGFYSIAANLPPTIGTSFWLDIRWDGRRIPTFEILGIDRLRFDN
jgi:hypothetical protein